MRNKFDILFAVGDTVPEKCKVTSSPLFGGGLISAFASRPISQQVVNTAVRQAVFKPLRIFLKNLSIFFSYRINDNRYWLKDPCCKYKDTFHEKMAHSFPKYF